MLTRWANQQGDISQQPLELEGSRGCGSVRPRESSLFICSSVTVSCRRAMSRLWSPGGGGYRFAWSWTFILAPVSEFLSWWAAPPRAERVVAFALIAGSSAASA